MLYREYGETGKMVSAVGFGGMRFSKEDYEAGDLSACSEVVRRAYELGVNYFDTAPGYCGEMSEKIYGEAFKQMNGGFYVSTKCGLWNAKDGCEARMLLERSLKRMGVEKINFYHLWSIKTMDDFHSHMKKGGIYEAAVQAREEGLIDHICFSTHLNGKEIAEVAKTGLFEGVTLGYNAVNFAYRREGVEACHKAGMGVVTMNPLGGGIIPQNPDYFSFIRQGSDDSLCVAALKFLIAQPEITVALSGMKSVAEVEENVKAAENILPSTPEALEAMAEYLNQNLDSLCTTCGYCDSCPQGVPIPKLMEAYNQYLLDGKDDSKILSRLSGHWGIPASEAGGCIACGQCEALCTQKLPIIERLNYIASIS